MTKSASAPGAALDQTKAINVADFGALGDGNRDDTGSIQAAIAYALRRPGGGTVHFPDGRYRTTAPVVLSVSQRAPQSLNIVATPGGAILEPASGVECALSLSTHANSDGTTNWLKVTGLRIEGRNTRNAIGIVVGAGSSATANVALEDVQVLRFAGGRGTGVHVRNAVACTYTRCYVARCDTNLLVKGTDHQGFPTLQLFDKCAFRDGSGRGVDLVMGHHCSWRGCLFESNAQEGFHCAPGITGDVTNCEVDNGWFEANWRGAANEGARYQVVAEGRSRGTLMLRIANSNFEGAPRAISWTNVQWGVLDNITVRDAPQQVMIGVGCAGNVVNWPRTLADFGKACSNASASTFLVSFGVAAPASPVGVLRAGEMPKNPQEGDVWHDGRHFYGRTGGVNKQLDG